MKPLKKVFISLVIIACLGAAIYFIAKGGLNIRSTIDIVQQNTTDRKSAAPISDVASFASIPPEIPADLF